MPEQLCRRAAAADGCRDRPLPGPPRTVRPEPTRRQASPAQAPRRSADAPHSLPPIAGREAAIQALVQTDTPVFLPRTTLKLDDIRSCFACALHMHQPTIPAGAQGELISHLQYMLEHPGEGDNHNAEPFTHCYRRLADLIPS